MPCPNHPDEVDQLRQCGRCGRQFCNDCLVELQGVPLCATCKEERVLDLRSGTPAAVAAPLRFASIGRRWAALIVDRLLWVGTMIVLMLPGAIFFNDDDLKAASIGLGFIAAYLLYVTYDALMVLHGGQTIGKRLLKVRVIRADGDRVRAGQAWGRAVTRGMAVHVLALVNYLPSLFTKEKTCLHDILAGTRVVDAEATGWR